MSIVVPEITVTGTQEALVRDNVANPDTDLGARAMTLLMQPYKGQTLQRAQAAYRKALEENPDAELPNFLKDDDVIAWYIAQPGYKDATTRENEIALSKANNELAMRRADLSRHKARLAQLTGDSNADMRAAVNSQIAGVEAEIEALEEQIEELE